MTVQAPTLPSPPQDEPAAPVARLPAFEPSPDALPAHAHEYLTQAREVVRAFHRSGASGSATVRATTVMFDRLLQGAFIALGGPQLPIALTALGGYGRRDLAPHSDLDVVLLHGSRGSPKAEVARFAEKLLYLLWDLRLEVGWGIRTPAECARLAADDHTARTALLDCRPLTGLSDLYQDLEKRAGEILTKRAAEFVSEKVDELRRRRARFGDTIYFLEPNLKQGEGGLRDLQSALWIARARFRVSEISDLLHRSILPPGEVHELIAARDFLWRVRNELHFQAGRKEDRLTFDRQVQVAHELGYEDSAEGLAVERFMRHVYLAATIVQRVADALVDRCEEAARRGPPAVRKIDGELKVFNGRLTVTQADLFERQPAAMVRLFSVADREGVPLHSWARDRVAHEVRRIDETVRSSPEVAATLREMLVRPGTRGEFLREMHEIGLLEAVIPEFARTRARTQHDLYHVYTVDVHCVFTAMRLYALRNGELAESEPALTRRIQEIPSPLPLYLAALLHDVAKGGVPGHAERGAVLARAVGERMQLAPQDVDDVEFLVRFHLVMSHVSQRRDLSDPVLIADFARQMGTPARLLMLYLLTFADMSSVAADTWNDWRARLLEELYVRALEVLEGSERAADPKKRLREGMEGRLSPSETEQLLTVMPEHYLRAATPREAVRHARLMRRARKTGFAACLLHRGGYTELTLCAPDRPGLLALFTGALAAHRIDILHAGIYSSSDGWAVDSFAVRGGVGGPLEHERWRGARTDLRAALEGKLDVEELLRRRSASRLQERFVPRVATHVAIDNRSAETATVIDVYAQDKIGLLHTIARTLHEQGAEILLAKIATEGHRIADGFYVRSQGTKITDAQTLARIEAALRAALG